MSQSAPATPKPWKRIGRHPLLSVEPWLTVYRETVQLPSGRIIDDFYRVVLPDFAVVVPMTTRGEIIMVRGYKHGLGRVTLSPPAGLLRRGEPPLVGAQRELLEETGHTAPEWKSLGAFVVDGNRQCGTMHLFLARQAAPARPPVADDMEELTIEFLCRERLLQALAAGEIGNLAGAGSVAMALLHELGH